ncbi:GntR family transcriptional regulator, partial [bacterium]|nr:GntR family transcriptional regulator [bacterium]
MKIVDRQNPRKLYLQLFDVLLTAMESGELSVGSQLPTEDQLCVQQGVSKAVVRSAMQELARKGYIRKIPGKGTFVETPPSKQGVWLSTLVTENMLDYGTQWDTEVVQ